MPRAWSKKDERQYKHILRSCTAKKCKAKGKRSSCKLDERTEKACKRIAAATVNKTRAQQGRVQLRGAATRSGVEIREVDTGGKNSLEFRASFAGSSVGSIRAYKTKLGGRVVYVVRNVDVRPEHRQRGIATALYEAAAQEACRRRSALASTERNPGAFSHDFWAKQERKGRVRVVKNPVRFRDPAYILDCSAAHDLSGIELRGLEGALASGSFVGAPGKLVDRDSNPDKIELGRRAGRITKVCPSLRFDGGDYENGHEIVAFTQSGDWAGRIDAEVRDGDLRVMYAEVADELQGCGVGTRLYEHLLRAAHRKKLRLVSDFARSDSAESFWQKQVKKGRAECIDDQPGHKYVPGEGVTPNVWPCRRFAIKSSRVKTLRGVDSRGMGARFEHSEQPGEVTGWVFKHGGKDVQKDFPSLEKAEAWLKRELKKDLGRDMIRYASFYVYGRGSIEYKLDRPGGVWMRSPSDERMTVFRVYE